MRNVLTVTALGLFSLGVFLLPGCSSSKYTTENIDADDRFARGKQKFDKGDYLKAIEEFQLVALQFQGSGVADDAQFYLAESYYYRDEYILAASEYETLIRRMRSSEWVPQAQYKRAMCYYELSPRPPLEQSYTRKAVDSFQEFIEYNPTDSLVIEAEAKIRELNDKMALKKYDTGRLYMRLEYYKSAQIVFEALLEQYHDSDWADDAHVGLVEALIARRRYREAKDQIERFFVRFLNSPLKTKVQRLQLEIDQKLNQGLNTVTPGSFPRDSGTTLNAHTRSP